MQYFVHVETQSQVLPNIFIQISDCCQSYFNIFVESQLRSIPTTPLLFRVSENIASMYVLVSVGEEYCILLMSVTLYLIRRKPLCLSIVPQVARFFVQYRKTYISRKISAIFYPMASSRFYSNDILYLRLNDVSVTYLAITTRAFYIETTRWPRKSFRK